MPDSNLIDRYQAHRTRRFLENEEKVKHWLPNWRSRHRRRILVLTLAGLFVLMLADAIACLFSTTVAPLAWPVLTIAFLPVWTALQIASGRQGDAPRQALDEWEIAQRNSARSIGLTVTQGLVLAVAAFLIFTSTVEWNVERLAYSGGLLAVTAMLIGACTPTIILGWTRPDPDPDDTEAEPEP